MAVAISPTRERNRIEKIASGAQVKSSPAASNPRRGPLHPSQTTPAASSLRAFIEIEQQHCEAYLIPFHRQWYENIAAIAGSTGLVSRSIGRLLNVRQKQPTHRVKHTSNIIGPNFRSLVGYLARSDPDMEIMPGDLHDPFQVDMAQGAKRWVPDHRVKDDYGRKELQLISWCISVGMGVSKAVFDPTGGPRMAAVDEETGRPLEDPDTRQPLLDRHGRPVLFDTGMSSTMVLPSFQYWYNSNARSRDELTVTGEKGWRCVNEVERRSPGLVKEFGLTPEEPFEGSAGNYERQVAQIVGPAGTYTGLSPYGEVEGFQVTEAYIAPYLLDPELFDGWVDPSDGERYDGEEFYYKGAFVMMAQGMIIECHPNEFLDLHGVMPRQDWNPYTIWPAYNIPGRMIPQGPPEPLIPIQHARDFSMSRIREAQKLMGQPKWFLPKGCGVTRNELTSEAGEKVYFNPGVGPPLAWSPAPMPAYAFNLIQTLEGDADRVGSTPPMTRGEAQGQVRSGLGVMALQEQSLTQYTPLVRELSYAKARHTRQLLLREIQYGDLPTRVPYEMQSGAWEQQMFFAQQMSPDFFIRIKAGTEMPRNQAAVMTELDRGIAWGALMPHVNPKDREHIARAMGWNLPPAFDGNYEENLRQARYENVLIATNQPEPLTHPVFNHEVHINEHSRFILSQRYREMAERDPTLHKRFSAHLGKHMGYLQLKQQGLVFPQPIPPFEDLQAVLPSGQTAAGGGSSLAASGGGPGQTAGPTNRGPATTGTGVQFGMARGGDASRRQTIESLAQASQIEGI